MRRFGQRFFIILLDRTAPKCRAFQQGFHLNGESVANDRDVGENVLKVFISGIAEVIAFSAALVLAGLLVLVVKAPPGWLKARMPFWTAAPLDQPDPQRILAFYQAHFDRGPEDAL